MTPCPVTTVFHQIVNRVVLSQRNLLAICGLWQLTSTWFKNISNQLQHTCHCGLPAAITTMRIINCRRSSVTICITRPSISDFASPHPSRAVFVVVGARLDFVVCDGNSTGRKHNGHAAGFNLNTAFISHPLATLVYSRWLSALITHRT